MGRIDFYKKRRELHKEMYGAIKDLMERHGASEIDFNEHNCDKGYVINASSDCAAVEELVVKIMIYNGKIEVMTEGSEDDDVWLDLEDDCLMASFETLYEAVYNVLEQN